MKAESSQVAPANQVPQTAVAQQIDTVRANFETTMVGYVAESIDDFHQDVDKTLQTESWNTVRKTDQFVTTAANVNRLYNQFDTNPDGEPQSVEKTYLAAVESFTAATATRKRMSPDRLDAIEKLDALASGADGRASVSALIYGIADVRKGWSRDTELPEEQRIVAKRELAELEEYAVAFGDMDIVMLDPDAHNAAMDPANDFLESHSPTSNAPISSEAVDLSIQSNIFYAKYAAELASSAIANQTVVA